VTLHLSDANARLPTFPRMGSTEYAFPVALKTGSSQGLRDAWTVAWTPRYLLGVWVGHPDARPMRELTGAASAGLIAHRILHRLHHDQRQGFADLRFPAPEGYRPVLLCGLTGKRATAACDRRFEEWFAPGEEPIEDDDAFLRLAIDRRNGRLAQANTPARFVEWRTFVDLPPRYAAWAAQAGLPRPPGAVSFGETLLPARPAGANGTTSGRSEAPRFRVAAPSDGLRLLRDPTIPAAHNTIALRAEISPPVPEVLWLVDGQPFQLAPYPYTARWPLQAGEHRIQARSPSTGEVSNSVRLIVE
jgi:penicillin-binding protein 1C